MAIDKKFDDLDTRFEALTTRYDNEIARLEADVKEQGKIIEAQQRFLEDVDSERRSNHLIVLGLKENEEDDDKTTFLGIAQTIGVNQDELTIDKCTRLGKLDGNREERTRPLKVTFDKSFMRNEVLKNAYKLKDQNEGDPYHKVFLKRDTHPDVRKEEKRLYDIFKEEKNKPENVGKTVLFDRKTRVVTCNGEEIDRFKLFTSFR